MSKTTTKDQCYYELKEKSTCRNKLLDFALSTRNWEKDTEKNKFSFLQVVVPRELYQDDIVLNTLYSQIKIPSAPRIFKMPANIYYAMHVDAWRGSALNMLLNDSANSTTFYHCGPFRRNQIHIETLEYKPDTYYLLNTQIKHGVLNSMQDRYVLSLGLGTVSGNQSIEDFYNIYKNKLIELGF